MPGGVLRPRMRLSSVAAHSWTEGQKSGDELGDDGRGVVRLGGWGGACGSSGMGSGE